MYFTNFIEVHLYKLSKTWTVIVFEGFRITKCFQKRVWIKNLLFNRCFLVTRTYLMVFLPQEIFFWTIKVCTSLSQIWENKFCGFSFTSSWFSSDNYWLIFAIYQEVLIRVLCYHKQMWIRFDCVLGFTRLNRVLTVQSSILGGENI